MASLTFISRAAGLPIVALVFIGSAEQENACEQSILAITETYEEVSH